MKETGIWLILLTWIERVNKGKENLMEDIFEFFRRQEERRSINSDWIWILFSSTGSGCQVKHVQEKMQQQKCMNNTAKRKYIYNTAAEKYYNNTLSAVSWRTCQNAEDINIQTREKSNNTKHYRAKIYKKEVLNTEINL